jgi:hypothetical protein
MQGHDETMKKLSVVALLIAALGATGCGNDTILSGISGDALGGNGNGTGDGGGDDEGDDDDDVPCEGDEAAMAEAAADLAENICADCNPAEGTAEHLYAEINPQDYTGGPLEVGLVIGNPAGIAGSTTRFKINGTEYPIPADAWKLSEDGTKGRVVMLREGGLPAGEYHVGLIIFAADAPAFEETEEPQEPQTAADAGATWLVECEGEDEPEEDPEEEPGDDEPADEPSDEDPA